MQASTSRRDAQDDSCAHRVSPCRVVHLASSHSAFDVRIFHKECRSLAAAGYQATVIAPHTTHEVVDGICVRAVPRYASRFGRLCSAMWHVCREALRQDADVYHLHDLELIPVGIFLRLRGKVVIYDIHEDYPRRGMFDSVRLPGRNGARLGQLLEPVENCASRFFSALVPATPAISSRFSKFGRRIALVQNFPRLEDFLPVTRVPWEKRASAVAYVGQMTLGRGTRELVEAINLVGADFQASLTLAGTFSPPSLKEELTSLPGWRLVRSKGFLDPAQVALLLTTVRAGLVTLHPEVRYVQSQPTKLFEYMAAGMPVIASDFPLWRDIIGGCRCGLLVDPENPKEIAKAIEFVLGHPEEAEAMGLRGRQAVESHYNWQNEEHQLLQLYSEQVRNFGRDPPAARA